MIVILLLLIIMTTIKKMMLLSIVKLTMIMKIMITFNKKNKHELLFQHHYHDQYQS